MLDVPRLRLVTSSHNHDDDSDAEATQMADQTKALALTALAAVANRCGYTLTAWELGIYEREMEQLGWSSALTALELIYRGLGGGQRWAMPSIDDIREKAGVTPVGDKAIAADVAGRILGAVVRYGDQHAHDELGRTVTDDEGRPVFRARAYVGELGWAVMERVFGHWRACGDGYTRDNHAHLFAQLRDTAVAMIEMARKGAVDRPPELPLPRLSLAPNALPAVIKTR